jgi:hypothetical protein
MACYDIDIEHSGVWRQFVSNLYKYGTEYSSKISEFMKRYGEIPIKLVPWKEVEFNRAVAKGTGSPNKINQVSRGRSSPKKINHMSWEPGGKKAKVQGI